MRDVIITLQISNFPTKNILHQNKQNLKLKTYKEMIEEGRRGGTKVFNSNLKCSQLLLILRQQLLQMLQLTVLIFILFLTFMLNSHSTLENGILPHECFNLLLQHHIFLYLETFQFHNANLHYY